MQHSPKSLVPTDEQRDIISRPLGAGDMLVVDAFAGTGKTTTFEMLTRTHPAKRFLYLCFNRDLADAGRARFGPNVEVKTSHSLAYGRVGYQYSKKLGETRVGEVRDELGLSDQRQAANALDTVKQFMFSCDTQILPAHVRDTEKGGQGILPIAEKLWRRMVDPADMGVKMPHDGYLKLWAHSGPDLGKFDVILFDEAQDANPLLLWFLLTQWREKRKALVIVGDRHQSIYGFRNSVNAMELVGKLATQRARLTQSFRFPMAVAAQANIVLRNFKGEQAPLLGLGKGARPEGPAGYLSRTNAALIARAVVLVNSGYRLNFAATKDSSKWNPYTPYRFQDMLDVLAIYQKRPEQVVSRYLARFKTWDDILEISEGSEGLDGDNEIRATANLVLNYSGSLRGVLNSITAACVAPTKADFCLSSGHRSKGQEWSETELAPDFIPVHDTAAMVKTKDKRGKAGFEQEINLFYVALTRTRSKTTLPFLVQQWFDQQVVLHRQQVA